jgi:hypothetical protein
MTSMSDSGSTLPATCTTFSSSKQRTTWAIASVSRMWARNWLPRPSPLLAPAHQARDVDELHGGRQHPLRA